MVVLKQDYNDFFENKTIMILWKQGSYDLVGARL